MGCKVFPEQLAWIRTCRCDVLQNKNLRDRLMRVLAKDEHQKGAQFRFQADQDAFFLARALLRVMLSSAFDVSASAWVFEKNYYGKPYVRFPQNLGFNVSHTKTMVACAIAQGVDVGVDIEEENRSTQVLSVAESIFSPDEFQALQAADTSKQAHLAVRLWTLKEAYIKAIGMGLSLPLKDFSIGLTHPFALKPPDRFSIDAQET